jgi:mannitol 2-dehydrogenase
MDRSTPITLARDHLPAIARRGVPVPRYDRRRLVPRIVHIGVGGFHRAHLALYVHELASQGADWAIAGLGLLEQDAKMAAALDVQDHLYTLIEKGNGAPCPAVIGSIVAYAHAPDGHDAAVAERVASPVTSILSLTITESGYAEQSDTFDRIAAALAVRRERAAGPLTILSCDNLPGNGDAARRAMLSAAARADDALAAWIEGNCTFPNSVVDRITPVTADADRDWLRDSAGIDDRWPVVAEPYRQWVMEDEFAAGRPRWEDVGAVFSDRIRDWELYKLRLLNAGHSCLAYLSALAGITYVHEAMALPAARTFLKEVLHREAMPTLAEIPRHPREDYIASVLERFANPGLRDQIARVCIDGSAKFPAFLIPTVVHQVKAGGPIWGAATALAGWARYLAVVDVAEQSFDTRAGEAQRHARRAVAEPETFLEFDAVFPAELRTSRRFRDAFSAAYRRIAERGPIAAMEAERTLERTGGMR